LPKVAILRAGVNRFLEGLEICAVALTVAEISELPGAVDARVSFGAVGSGSGSALSSVDMDIVTPEDSLDSSLAKCGCELRVDLEVACTLLSDLFLECNAT
jgi:hypothetical protein